MCSSHLSSLGGNRWGNSVAFQSRDGFLMGSLAGFDGAADRPLLNDLLAQRATGQRCLVHGLTGILRAVKETEVAIHSARKGDGGLEAIFGLAPCYAGLACIFFSSSTTIHIAILTIIVVIVCGEFEELFVFLLHLLGQPGESIIVIGIIITSQRTCTIAVVPHCLQNIPQIQFLAAQYLIVVLGILVLPADETVLIVHRRRYRVCPSHHQSLDVPSQTGVGIVQTERSQNLVGLLLVAGRASGLLGGTAGRCGRRRYAPATGVVPTDLVLPPRMEQAENVVVRQGAERIARRQGQADEAGVAGDQTRDDAVVVAVLVLSRVGDDAVLVAGLGQDAADS